MGYKDILPSFDPDAYRARIESDPDAEICKREILKRRQILETTCGMVLGASSVPITYGVSLPGVGYAYRRQSIAEQKLEIIETIMKERGLEPHVKTTRDRVIPVTTSIVGFGASLGVGFGVTELCDIAGNGIEEKISSAIAAPADFAKGMGSGIEQEASEITDTLQSKDATGEMADTTAPPVSNELSQATIDGKTAGEGAAEASSKGAAALASSSLFEMGANKLAKLNARVNRSTSSRKVEKKAE